MAASNLNWRKEALPRIVKVAIHCTCCTVHGTASMCQFKLLAAMIWLLFDNHVAQARCLILLTLKVIAVLYLRKVFWAVKGALLRAVTTFNLRCFLFRFLYHSVSHVTFHCFMPLRATFKECEGATFFSKGANVVNCMVFSSVSGVVSSKFSRAPHANGDIQSFMPPNCLYIHTCILIQHMKTDRKSVV